MITRNTLKREIDNVQDQYLGILYNIIKSFEQGQQMKEFEPLNGSARMDQKEWVQFIDQFAGSLADDPIERGDQGTFEIREEII